MKNKIFLVDVLFFINFNYFKNEICNNYHNINNIISKKISLNFFNLNRFKNKYYNNNAINNNHNIENRLDNKKL